MEWYDGLILFLVAANLFSSVIMKFIYSPEEKGKMKAQIGELEKQVETLKLTQVSVYKENIDKLKGLWTEAMNDLEAVKTERDRLRELGKAHRARIAALEEDVKRLKDSEVPEENLQASLEFLKALNIDVVDVTGAAIDSLKESLSKVDSSMGEITSPKLPPSKEP